MIQETNQGTDSTAEATSKTSRKRSFSQKRKSVNRIEIDKESSTDEEPNESDLEFIDNSDAISSSDGEWEPVKKKPRISGKNVSEISILTDSGTEWSPCGDTTEYSSSESDDIASLKDVEEQYLQ